MTDSPADLLVSLSQLKQKVRHDRHSYALPLLVFAALILIAPVIYWSSPWPVVPPDGDSMVVGAPGPFPIFESPWVWHGGDNTLIEWYWMLGLITCFAMSAWWYRRRAERIGVETDTRTYLLIAGAALVGMVFGVRLLRLTIEMPLDTSLYSRPEINLPILIGSAVLSAVAVLVGVRWRKLRVMSAFVAALFAMVMFSAIAVYMINGLAGLLIIAGALLALAWVERSPLLAVVGVLFTAASLHANLQGMSHYVFTREPLTQVQTLADVALPALVLTLGGVIALVQSKRGAR